MPSPLPSSFVTRPAIHAGTVALIAGIIYFVTRAPGVMYTDSGELAAAAATLGVAHPTGYPLFILIGHLWSLLPWSSIIDGMNIFAGVVTASAVGMTVLTIDLIQRRMFDTRTSSPSSSEMSLFLADAGALLLGMAPVVWAQGTSIEVYGLNLLLITIALYCVLRASVETDGYRWTITTSFVVGLMLTNHVSSLFLTVGLLIILSSSPAFSFRKMWPYIFLPALLPLILYAYLPLRSAQLPPLNWGMTHLGVFEFFYHVKGTQYGVWLFSDKKAAEQNARLLQVLLSEMLLWIGWIPVIAGLVMSWIRMRRVMLGLLLVVVGNLAISLGYSIPDIDSYFLPTLLISAIFFAIGVYALISLRTHSGRLASIALILPIVGIIRTWPEADLSTHRAVPLYTQWALENADSNAIVISRQWDYLLSSMWYEREVEHHRTDVIVIEKELLRRTWYIPYLQERFSDVVAPAQQAIDRFLPLCRQFNEDGDEFMNSRTSVIDIQTRWVEVLQSIIEGNIDRRPVYITPEILSEERDVIKGYNVFREGPLLRVRRMTDTTIPDPSKDFRATQVLESLKGRNGRLDSALQVVVMSLTQQPGR